MERKYMNSDKGHWKEPELTTLVSEVDGDTNIQSKQARVLQSKSQPKALMQWFSTRSKWTTDGLPGIF